MAASKADRTVGRPILLTDEMALRIFTLFSEGNMTEVVAKSVGVSARTIRSWLARGKKEGEGRFHDFLQGVRAATAAAETSAVKVIRGAMLQDPKWAAWYLEHRYPERWGSLARDIRELMRLVKEQAKEMEDIRRRQGATT